MSFLRPSNPDADYRPKTDDELNAAEKLHIAQQITDAAKEQMRLSQPVDIGALALAVKFAAADPAVLSLAKALQARARGAP